jgi:hypothetical protein
MALCVLGAFSLLASLMCDAANAQTNDVPLDQVSGTYTMCCMTPIDIDLDELCFVRTDLASGVVELGCVGAPTATKVCSDLTVAATLDVDAKIRCYVTDDSGLVSNYSPNAGTVDFTRPTAPNVVPQ